MRILRFPQRKRSAMASTSGPTNFFIVDYPYPLDLPSLTKAAEHCHTVRDFHRLDKIADLIIRLHPASTSQGIGCYFKALSAKWIDGNLPKSAYYSEMALKYATRPFQAKALVTLAGTAELKGDSAARAYFSTESLRVNADDWASFRASLDIAIMRSAEGDHRQALADIESLYNAAMAIGRDRPGELFFYFNAKAMEEMAVGKYQSAEASSRIAINSPLAERYPEWQETWDDIQTARHRPTLIYIPSPHAFDGYAQVSTLMAHYGCKTVRPRTGRPKGQTTSRATKLRLLQARIYNDPPVKDAVAEKIIQLIEPDPIERLKTWLITAEDTVSESTLDRALELLGET